MPAVRSEIQVEIEPATSYSLALRDQGARLQVLRKAILEPIERLLAHAGASQKGTPDYILLQGTRLRENLPPQSKSAQPQKEDSPYLNVWSYA